MCGITANGPGIGDRPAGNVDAAVAFDQGTNQIVEREIYIQQVLGFDRAVGDGSDNAGIGDQNKAVIRQACTVRTQADSVVVCLDEARFAIDYRQLQIDEVARVVVDSARRVRIAEDGSGIVDERTVLRGFGLIVIDDPTAAALQRAAFRNCDSVVGSCLDRPVHRLPRRDVGVLRPGSGGNEENSG